MLQTFLDVQQVVHQEVLNSFEYASQDSPLGQVELWTNHLSSTVLRQALVLERRVSEAAFQMTSSFQEGSGRCRCGGVKSLKFKWKQSPIDHPSFFWGCVKYTHNDRHLHDSAKSCPGTTWKIMEKHRMAMMPSDVRLLHGRCSHLLTDWLAKEPNSATENQCDLVAKIFGGRKQHLPLKSQKDVSSLLKELCSVVDSAIPKEPEVGREEDLLS